MQAFTLTFTIVFLNLNKFVIVLAHFRTYSLIINTFVQINTRFALLEKHFYFSVAVYHINIFVLKFLLQKMNSQQFSSQKCNKVKLRWNWHILMEDTVLSSRIGLLIRHTTCQRLAFIKYAIDSSDILHLKYDKPGIKARKLYK